jgi:hypothetical protein
MKILICFCAFKHFTTLTVKDCHERKAMRIHLAYLFFQAYGLYEEKVRKLVVAVEPLLDLSVADTVGFLRKKSVLVKMAALLHNQQLTDAGLKIRT